MKDLQQTVDTQSIAACLTGQADVIVGYLFGSVARGQARPQSDVDIAALLDSAPTEPDLDERSMVERQLTLMGALAPYSGREVQVVLLNRVTPLLAYEVIREGIRLFERSTPERVSFEVATMKHYFDIQPMLAFQQRALFQRIRKVGLGQQTKRDHGTIEAAERLLARLTESSGR
jgi:predicted nucleotidyltransferase